MIECKECKNRIDSPKITGELCTKCYFKAKKNESQKRENTETPEDGLISRADSKEIGVSESRASEVEDSTGGENYEIKKENHPNVNAQKPIEGVKYCQSCIERGYGLRPATREFRKNEFICDDCFKPLLDNTLGYAVERAVIERVIPQIDNDKPVLEQFYNLLEWPEPLRYTRSEHVLQNRNEIFNHRALALANMNLEEVVNRVEELQVMLFQIKISLEPLTDYINRVKADERQKANLESIRKGQTEKAKGPSKVKADKDQKMADAMFKIVESDPAKRLKMFQDMTAKARLNDFKKITGEAN